MSSILKHYNEAEVLEAARRIVKQRTLRRGSAKLFSDPKTARKHLQLLLIDNYAEVFCVAFLDNKRRLLEWAEMFHGTIDGASVHPRVIVQRALGINAAAVILVHNHPSGIAEPSRADHALTRRVINALALVDIRVIDHIVIGDDPVSFAERGWLDS